jgi:hypothetical protein
MLTIEKKARPGKPNTCSVIVKPGNFAGLLEDLERHFHAPEYKEFEDL